MFNITHFGAMKKDCHVVVLFVAFLCLSILAKAQTQGTGVQHYGNNYYYNERSRLEVDPTTLALNLTINLSEYPGRGISQPVFVRYNSKSWSMGYNGYTVYTSSDPVAVENKLLPSYDPNWTTSLFRPQFGSVGSGQPYIVEFDELNASTGRVGVPSGGYMPNPYPYTLRDYFVRRGRLYMPDGSSFELRKSDYADSGLVGDSGVYMAVDGSQVRFDADTNTAYFPDGSRYVGVDSDSVRLIDKNGNTITYNANNWVDTLGRVYNYMPEPIPIDQEADKQWVLPGVDGANRTYTFRWRRLENVRTDPGQPLRYKGNVCLLGGGLISPALFNGFASSEQTNSSYTIVDTPLTIGGNCQPFNPVVLHQIELPNGTAYTFTYNIYGEVDKIVLPTGGYKRYVYDYIPPTGGAYNYRGDSYPYAQVNRGVVEAWEGVNENDTNVPHRTYSVQASPSDTTYTVKSSVPGVGRTERDIHQQWFFGSSTFGFDSSLSEESILGKVDEERVYDASGSMIRRTINKWVNTAQSQPCSYTVAYPNPIRLCNATRDPRLIRRVEVLLDTGGNAKAKATEFQYDADLNVMRQISYDYASISQSVAQSGTINQMPNGALLRTEETTFLVNDPEISQAIRDAYRARNLIRLPSKAIVRHGSGAVVAATEYKYDEGGYPLTTYPAVSSWTDPQTAYRGNATTVRSWQDFDYSTGVRQAWAGWTSGIWVETHAWYDQCGSAVKVRDAKNQETITSYEDNFYGASPQNTFAYPTRVTTPGPALTAITRYDFNTGLVREVTDTNNVKTRTDYNDPLNRATEIVLGVGTSVESHTVIQYEDDIRRVTNISDKERAGESSAGNGLKSMVIYDGLGRAIRNAMYEGSTWAITDARYDPLGRVSQVSNPYRADDPGVASAPPDTWTTTEYDTLSRVIRVTTPDGAHVDTSYLGVQVTVTDQAGKTRRSETDALGRLIRVTEDPDGSNFDTNYSYDTLDNLRLVTQGSQTRTFAYDSLSRLVSATNPESGTVTYAYDPNGNLVQKTDARGVRTTMDYDALNRVKSKVYSGTPSGGTEVANATPPVHYFYDDYSGMLSGAPSWTGTPSKGRLTGVTYGSGSEGTYYKYDAAGRIVTNHQRQGTSNYVTTYSYNLAGAVIQENRGAPARRRNWTYYDAAGRIMAMQTGAFNGNGFPAHDLVRGISYTPFGALQSETYGNELIHSRAYNERLQPIEIRLGRPDDLESVFRLGYIYGTADTVDVPDPEIVLAHNNGNVGRIKYLISGTVQYTQTFKYDQLNRLSYAVEHKNGTYNEGARAWYQSFDYDPHGNRGINHTNTSDNADADNTALELIDFSAANNRITRAGFGYDAAGNLTTEPGKSYTYDAENRLVTATVGGVLASQYFYDGNSRRVKKMVGGVVTRFEYGAGGELIAEWNDDDSNMVVQKDYFYKGGALIATSMIGNNGKYEHATADHLGTPRAWTDDDGNLVAGGRHDYMPFGEELLAEVGTRTAGQGYAVSTQQDGQRKQFGSKERDYETTLDYFLARYYSSGQGRFTNVDPGNAGAMLDDPQSWNGYSYTLNSPLVYTDPDGKCPSCPDNVYVNLADTAYTVKRDETVGGWKAVRVYEPGAGYRGVVFRGTYKGNTEYIFATAGTGASGSNSDLVLDIIADGAQLFGASGQYRGSAQLAKYLATQFPGISFTGHSLGGGLAAANALSVGGKAVTFNAAGLSAWTKIELGILGKSALINAYIVNGEFVDRNQSDKANGTRIYMGEKVSWSQQFGAHSMATVKERFGDYWFMTQLRFMQSHMPIYSEKPKILTAAAACKKYGGDACN
jgi:RHS repeat-associated protein